GEIKELPLDSTPIDFAYAIHTAVGDHCAGAKINGRIVPLKHLLKSGDMVEIITASSQKPNRGWLPLVRTSRAKSRIRHWLKKEEQERTLKVGTEVCERELRKRNLSLKKITRSGHLKEVLKSFSCNNLDDLLRKVGTGKITVTAIVNRMQPEELRSDGASAAGGGGPELKAGEVVTAQTAPGRRKTAKRSQAIVIDGVDDMMVKISKCCMPVPGDDIIGFISSGRGISVHKAGCVNFLATDPERHIEVSWNDGTEVGLHQVKVLMVAQNQRGLIAGVSNTISEVDANIVSMEAHTSSDNLAIVNLVIEVDNLDHLARVLLKLRRIPGVIEARRK
ncbi:MAG: bifunctional (p)ppGpp synthetase/guanosine-3',5'-bis(diphosphate) 3'-pyrophosphohydrolase, partial [Desulfobulbaceae bacterium]|nr:bifunctional (p)ppGpp synthetase/guanosine-3',5'-bis(diphosphate) 3'-pyrophosphohydrolase [Desulfobulbaceae bacterium]